MWSRPPRRKRATNICCAPQDRVLMKRAHLLHEAKRSALFLADGYRAPQPQPVYAAGAGGLRSIAGAG